MKVEKNAAEYAREGKLTITGRAVLTPKEDVSRKRGEVQFRDAATAERRKQQAVARALKMMGRFLAS